MAAGTENEMSPITPGGGGPDNTEAPAMLDDNEDIGSFINDTLAKLTAFRAQYEDKPTVGRKPQNLDIARIVNEGMTGNEKTDLIDKITSDLQDLQELCNKEAGGDVGGKQGAAGLAP